jgi:hypothetical protein
MAGYQFDIGSEAIFPVSPDGLAEWARIRGGKMPHPNVFRRYYTNPNRFGLTLPTLVVGGRRMTSAAAIRWFIEATSTVANARPAASGEPEAVAATQGSRRSLGVGSA